MEGPRVFTLPLDDVLGTPGAGRPQSALALAQALVSSPPWRTLDSAVMVVRPEPRPLLAVIGDVDEASVPRLEALHPQLVHTLQCLRYVDYAQAEADCERLADVLLSRIGREALHRCRFAAIPRGGHIVLGMLAYLLDLAPRHLGASAADRTPVVVVDDCALTGVRFGQFVDGWRAESIVFATLYSHPGLRAAIEADVPGVETCLSARDLHDHAPARLGDEYDAWRRRWTERSGPHGRWVGMPDHVCFPWNEPDVTLWNPVTERDEPGWRVVPPDACLKNRPRPDAPRARLQVQPEGRGPLRPAEGVVFGTLEGDVVVAPCGAETAFRLTGVAAATWQAIVQEGALSAVNERLLKIFDVDRATLETDTAAFVEELLAANLLEDQA